MYRCARHGHSLNGWCMSVTGMGVGGCMAQSTWCGGQNSVGRNFRMRNPHRRAPEVLRFWCLGECCPYGSENSSFFSTILRMPTQTNIALKYGKYLAWNSIFAEVVKY